MILFLFGSDTFRSRVNLHNSITQFKAKRDPQGYNVVFVDGKKDEPGKILTEIMSVPFLAEKRMIVVENILSSSDKELLSELIERTKSKKFPNSNIIVFWQGEALSKVKEAKELQTVLAKEKYAQEFSLLTGAQLAGWAEREIRERGGSIEPAALQFICQNIGGDMWQLNSLIDQLVAYTSYPLLTKEGRGTLAENELTDTQVKANPSAPPLGKGRRPITLADTQLFLDEKIDDNIFNMVDAVVSGNKKLAFKLLNEQRRLGEEDSKIFGLIIWQFRILFQMADLLEREPNITSDLIAKRIGVHPFVVKKNIAIARRLSLATLHKIYQQLLDIDVKTKTGQAGQSLLLDVFVGTI